MLPETRPTQGSLSNYCSSTVMRRKYFAERSFKKRRLWENSRKILFRRSRDSNLDLRGDFRFKIIFHRTCCSIEVLLNEVSRLIQHRRTIRSNNRINTDYHNHHCPLSSLIQSSPFFLSLSSTCLRFYDLMTLSWKESVRNALSYKIAIKLRKESDKTSCKQTQLDIFKPK